MLVEAGKQVLNFSQLRDDGTTTSACWIYSGCWNENGNNMARRDNSDPDDTGAYLNWTFAWPLNRRILYNRASCDMDGKPWDPSRKLIEWDGAKWTGYDVPDIAADREARRGHAVHHEPGGRLASVQPGHDARRAVPDAHGAVRDADRQRA